ncbi:MAG: AAA family ATPase [Oceanicoccus sp.]
MYHRYFGLKEAPFSIAVNPRYFFMSARHQDALAHLLYGVGIGGGFILLTGEVGTGKTTVNRCLLEQLPENTDIAIILNPAMNAIELLATVCEELGIPHESGEQSLKVLTDKLHQFLLDNHGNGRNTVLLIDEAQHLQFAVLEQIRLLTNLETNTKKLLQIILVGQPELRSLLNKPELRQLAQRITARYQLKPLNLEETQAYIRHRLQVAGLPANQDLFSRNIVKGIYKASRGVPRIINVLCDRMLLGTFGKNKTIVDRAMLKQAIAEVMGEDEELQLHKPVSIVPWLLAVTAISLVYLLWWQWPIIKNSEIGFLGAPTVHHEIDNPSSDVATYEKVPHDKLVALSPDVMKISTISTMSELWINDEKMAINELLKWLEIPHEEAGPFCMREKVLSPRCEQIHASTWQALMKYNRPAVLSLITTAKNQAYAVLIHIDNQQATLSYNGEKIDVPLALLGELWTGDFTIIWHPADSYENPFSENFRGPVVTWLAEKFAQLDGQSQLLSHEEFNAVLAERVKIFQRSHQLQDDGVVGLMTLLKLNEQLGVAKTLNPTNVQNTVSAEGG